MFGSTKVKGLGSLLLCLLMGFPWVAQAQWKPRPNIELIVSVGVSGGNDKTARLLARVLQGRKMVSAFSIWGPSG
jgi:tripartite-type tricarboxylate transporter receptor subunit TctC